MTTEHDPSTCPDPACPSCLDHERRESVVRLELAIMEREHAHPSGAWVDDTLTVDALDVRNVLDLLRGA